MTKVIIIGSGTESKATALIERLQKENKAVEIIHVESVSELKDKGIVYGEDLGVVYGDVVREMTIKEIDIEPLSKSNYQYYDDDNKKSRYQKRQFRLPATPIKKRRR